MYCIHRGHLFPVGNKTLHTYKGGYIVGILRLLDTPFQSRGFLHLEKGSLKVYPLAYIVICRLARLEGLCGGHCQLPLNKSGKLETGFAKKKENQNCHEDGSIRFCKSGKCCLLRTTNPKIGNGCDTLTQRLLPS